MIAIVTDSSVGITRAEAKKLNLFVVPLSYSVDGRLYNESFADKNGEYETLLSKSSNCKTSQISVSAFMSVFNELVRKGYEVLCIVISSRLSGTYSSAVIAAKEIGPDKITVVDSLTTAGGLYMLIKKAALMAQSGESLKEISAKTETLREKVGIVFSVGNMNALRKSGRLGFVRQSVGTILNIRPVLLCENGTIISEGVARGKTKLIDSLIEKIPENASELIVHYNGEKGKIRSLHEALSSSFKGINAKTGKIGPVLSIHLGHDVIGVSWMAGE